MEVNLLSERLKSTRAVEMNLFSYVVARDFGFAPNPFNQVCTLATCKPKIRCKAQIDDVIVGSAPSPNQYKLVFYMRVDEILKYNAYWSDPRFQGKKPNLFGSKKAAFGDNIYHTDAVGNWLQLDSHHTNEDGSSCSENISTDTSCENVLLSRQFAYWGGEGPTLPPQLYGLIKRGPGHKSACFSDEFKAQAVGWLSASGNGFLGRPGSW
ncbi:Nmad2 family putative nucleotide modification protein [Paraburkholderia sediminicola]|uniref:Nmad2 family putative nucleotide modification protein n=1 Tax=Paraburkholderia sediminicola TaxID=458836 RepID=UPI0038B75CAA